MVFGLHLADNVDTAWYNVVCHGVADIGPRLLTIDLSDAMDFGDTNSNIPMS